MEIDVSFFSSGYLDVSVHRVPDVWLWIHHTTTEDCSARFPHSEISGSKDICSSPKLFAAYHVFHRLLVPRHPPCALSSLTSFPMYSVTSAGCVSNLIYCLMFLGCLDLDISIYLSIYSICGFQGTFATDVLSVSGDKGIRTPDPLLARQVLSQLSYIPGVIWHPPALPCRLQHSTIGRLGLNRRVRDGYGCLP